MTLGEWLTRWLPDRPMTAARRSREHLVGLIVEAVGEVELADLTTAHARAVLDHITATRGLSSTTARQAHQLLARALRDALRQGRISHNVAVLVPTVPVARDARTPLTVAQVRRVLTAVEDDPLRSRWVFALLYGASQGEALGLEWDRIHTGTVELSWRLQRLRWQHGCMDPCTRRRAALCPQRLLAPTGCQTRVVEGSLALTRLATDRVLPLIPAMSDLLRRAGGARSGLVWTHGGQPIEPSTDSAAWRQLMVDLELPPVALPRVPETTATLMLQSGIDLPVIESIIGAPRPDANRHLAVAGDTAQRDAFAALARALRLA